MVIGNSIECSEEFRGVFRTANKGEMGGEAKRDAARQGRETKKAHGPKGAWA
jgi:hypothetical protein